MRVAISGKDLIEMLRSIGFKIPDHARVIFNSTGSPYASGVIEGFIYPDGSNEIGEQPTIIAFDGAEEAEEVDEDDETESESIEAIANIFSHRNELIEKYKNGDISVKDELVKSSGPLYVEINKLKSPERRFLYNINDFIQRGKVADLFSSPNWTPRRGIELTFEGMSQKDLGDINYALSIFELPKAKNLDEAKATLLNYYDSIAKK